MRWPAIVRKKERRAQSRGGVGVPAGEWHQGAWAVAGGRLANRDIRQEGGS